MCNGQGLANVMIFSTHLTVLSQAVLAPLLGRHLLVVAAVALGLLEVRLRGHLGFGWGAIGRWLVLGFVKVSWVRVGVVRVFV